jgi:hypothetical protein
MTKCSSYSLRYNKIFFYSRCFHLLAIFAILFRFLKVVRNLFPLDAINVWMKAGISTVKKLFSKKLVIENFWTL